MIRRLRIKFVCTNMAIVTVMLAVIFGLLLHSNRENMEKQSQSIMQSILTDRPVTGRGKGSVPLPWFRVTLDRSGKQTIVSNGFFTETDSGMIQEAIRLARESDQQQGILKNQKLRFRKRTDLLEERIAFVYISSEMETTRFLIRSVAFVGSLSFLAFLLLSLALARWAVRPVEEAWNRQRQFVADASHELKTPLAVILTNAELLQDPSYSQQERQVFFSGILTMTRQMRSLVERLLDLARVDNGTARMGMLPLDLTALVEDSLLPFEPLYFERQLQLQSQLEPGIRVSGSESHLRQVLDILLDNGAKYTAAAGTVRICLRRYGRSCLLSVAGPGESISREDLENIFRRFYRVDKARHRDGSYGLGLAIAESIVREHKGRIWAESQGGINTFFIQLPQI